MTAEERKARAEARAAQWEQERQDKDLIADVLRDVLKDKTATAAQRLYAARVLEAMNCYHFTPSDVAFPDKPEEIDLTPLRERLKADA